jgi:hypothetical protein
MRKGKSYVLAVSTAFHQGACTARAGVTEFIILAAFMCIPTPPRYHRNTPASHTLCQPSVPDFPRLTALKMTTLCPAVPTICQLGTQRVTQPCRPAARQRLPPVLRLPPLPAHASVHPHSRQPVDPAPLHEAPAAAPGLAARLAAPGVLRTIALCAAAAALAAAMPGAARAAAAAAADSGGGGLAAWAQCEITAGTCVHSATRMPGYASRRGPLFIVTFSLGLHPPPLP